MQRRIVCSLLSLFFAAGLAARLQAQDQNDPLTEDEVQQIRDNKINPDERIRLYLKFIDERLDSARQLAGPGKTASEKARIHDKFDEFTNLCDELEDNMETYDSAHADIRKSLKDVVADAARWPQVLNTFGSDPSYDFTRRTALEAAQSAADEAHQMSLEQEVYFDVHKKSRGRNGNGPS